MQTPTPTSPFTPDDERNLALYLAVLKARAEGIPDAEIAQDLFGLDGALEPERARMTVESWHRRALQLSEPALLRRIASPSA
jgi:hypothetical protein